MGVRHDRYFPGVPFARHQHDRAGVSGNEVRAGHPDVGLADQLAQLFAGEHRQLLGGLEWFLWIELGVEQAGDLVF